jgi:hypothetical protein
MYKKAEAGNVIKLRTETDPVSETCFSSNYLESGRWTKSENTVILCEIQECLTKQGIKVRYQAEAKYQKTDTGAH